MGAHLSRFPTACLATDHKHGVALEGAQYGAAFGGGR